MKVSKNLNLVSIQLFNKVIYTYKNAKFEKVNNNVIISIEKQGGKIYDLDKVLSEFIKDSKIYNLLPSGFEYEITTYETELQNVIILE